MKILCLCLGNICRSPTAEAVLRAKALSRGLEVEVESAGTGDWHTGEPPHVKTQAAARARGYDMSALHARQITEQDLERFDLILTMDTQNLRDAQALARKTPKARARIERFLDAAGLGEAGEAGNVPDPYYTGTFDEVLALIETASDALLDQLQERSAAAPNAR